MLPLDVICEQHAWLTAHVTSLTTSCLFEVVECPKPAQSTAHLNKISTRPHTQTPCCVHKPGSVVAQRSLLQSECRMNGVNTCAGLLLDVACYILVIIGKNRHCCNHMATLDDFTLLLLHCRARLPGVLLHMLLAQHVLQAQQANHSPSKQP